MPHPHHPHPHLTVCTDGPVRTITLDNPSRRNAQTPSLWAALAEQAQDVPDDVRVVVLRGTGGVFSAGIDVAMFSAEGVAGEESMADLLGQGPQQAQEAIARYQQGFSAWAQCPAIVIAAVEGYAIGAGFQLALAADLRVCSTDARFAMRETSLGLVPDLAGTHTLVRLVGYSRALEICATGRFVEGPEAAALGLVTAAVPAEQLDAALDLLVSSLLSAPPAALRALKPLLLAAQDAPVHEQLERERRTQVPLLRDLLLGERP